MPVILRWLLRLGPTNPITVRLVQGGSRRTRHMYIRSAYLAVLIVVLLWALLLLPGSGQLSYRDLAARGAETFTLIAFLEIALICLLSPVFMAGAIAQESNPRTWDILLTTPMGSLQVVLGNLFGRLFFVLALLVASLPLFALTQYFGGVPGRSILASYLIAGSAALIVGASAIALSVSRLVGKRAVFAFYVSVVSYLAVTAALDLWLRSVGRCVGGGAASGGGGGGVGVGGGVTYMTGLNPFLALRALLNPSGYPRAPAGTVAGLGSWFLEKPVTTWCVGSAFVSVLLIGLSTLTLRSGGVAGVAGGASGIPWHRRLLRLGAKGSENRPPRNVWTNPIAWREAAARNATMGRIIARWSFIAIGALFGMALVALLHTGAMLPGDFRLALLTTVWGEAAIITLVAINMASTAVSREREDGTLDLLLTTPITPGQYITGKLRGLVAYLLPMIAVPVGTVGLAGIDVIILQAGGSSAATVRSALGVGAVTAPTVLPEALIVSALSVVPFIAACVMIGLQWSLKSKGTIGSVIATVGVVGVLGGIVGLCGWRAGAEMSVIGPVLSAMSPATALLAAIYPAESMADTVSSSADGLVTARISLFVGSVIAVGVYAVVIYGIHSNMTRTFDFTVRKLAGTA